jgi:crotonobetainyl-CoA:carnitine CoA-transferase CaiB-like acyl-CoA transferase
MAERRDSTSGAKAPLDGVVVLDLSRVLAGPLCTQMLSDHGAEVIKIEPPTGDETRGLGPPFTHSGDAAYYAALNRGKQAISVDLSTPAGRRVLARMVEKADVLVENFLPGTMERWGLGYEDVLAPKSPRLVYCTISGFGADGPMGGLPGYDAVLQAICGLMSVNGSVQSGPTRVGIPLVDHLTGYVALTGILMALRARELTGRGQRVEATLFDTALSLLVPHAANWLASGKTPELLGSAHPNIAPYDRFTVGDEEMFIGVVNDGQFKRFCECIGRPELTTDSRFESNARRLENRDILKTALEGALRGHSAGLLCDALMRVGVPAGVVNSVPQAFEQAHAQHRRTLIKRQQYTGIRSPMRLSMTPGEPGDSPPGFAQHCSAVLARFGFNEDEVASLRASGAIATEVKRNRPMPVPPAGLRPTGR